MGRLSYKLEAEDPGTATASTIIPDLLFERRVLTFVTAIVFCGLFVWLAAVSTNYWVIVVGGLHGLELPDKGLVFLWSHSGLWQRCDIFATLEARDVHLTKCEYHSYHSEENNFEWAELACVIIVLILISLSCGFSIYSLCHARYTYKRMAGALHGLTCAMLLVVIEMVESEGHLSQHHDEFQGQLLKAGHYYGYSYLMAWIVFTICALSCVAFFTWSKKRKHLNHDLETNLH
jgi:uncharacterized membrane protein